MTPIRRLILPLFAAAALLCAPLARDACASPDHPTLTDHAVHVDAAPAVAPAADIVAKRPTSHALALESQPVDAPVFLAGLCPSGCEIEGPSVADNTCGADGTSRCASRSSEPNYSELPTAIEAKCQRAPVLLC